MDFENFTSGLHEKEPPAYISAYLLSLWHDARGNWHKAHEIIQDIHNDKGSHIHAYLHKKEGDISNARYWYSRAGKPFPVNSSLQEEWEELVKMMLA